MLEPGDYPVRSIGFDVPEREQTAGPDTVWVEGVVTVTSAGDQQTAGFLRGRGGGTLRSNYTGELLDLDYTVAAFAFRDH